MESILEMRGTDPEFAPVETAEDTMLAAFSPFPLHHRLSLMSVPRGTVPSIPVRVRMFVLEKKEQSDLEAARRASLLDEEARQMRSRELVVGASSSRVEFV